ncbi:MAG TPA: nuclear transport factor 2 family protein [Gemmatimonadales bacterium]|nr:nuclear transport factor 2 family protein [Gemmatimonadales bacterium]
MTPHRPYAGFLLCLTSAFLAACGNDANRPLQLTAQDSSAIERIRSAYVAAWLADDTSAVLASMDSAALLLPPGRLPVKGHDAIRAFWWPTDGSRTTITDFQWSVEEMVGTHQLAFTRGLSTVAWQYQKDTVQAEQTSRTVSLTIFARGADGSWRIIRQMWGPPLPN